MNDKSPLLRQWQLLAALAARPAGGTVVEFAREHAVDQKTIRRDLVVLRKAGFPLEESLGDHGRKHWTLAPSASLPSLSLNWQEAISLYLARQFMGPLAGTHFGLSARRAFQKIRSTLGQSPLKYLDKMSRAFHVTGAAKTDYAPKADLLDDLTRAIEEHRVVQLVYQSERSTEPVSRDVHPLALISHHGAMYLAAHAPDHGERRTYKLDRMESAFVSDLRFPKPAEFSPEEFLSGALGVYRGSDGPAITVRIRFHPSVARFVQEKRWHASQQLTPEPDGSLIAEYRLTSLVEVKSWLLSWGRHAEVLDPPALIADLRAEITALSELYSRSGSHQTSESHSESRQTFEQNGEADSEVSATSATRGSRARRSSGNESTHKTSGPRRRPK